MFLTKEIRAIESNKKEKSLNPLKSGQCFLLKKLSINDLINDLSLNPLKSGQCFLPTNNWVGYWWLSIQS